MKSSDSEHIDVAQLRVGHYIELDLGWMSHPFPTSSFKITSNRQIEALHGLGLKQVRWVPSRSDPVEDDTGSLPQADEASAARALDQERERRRARAALIERQQRTLRECEQKFGSAQQLFRRVLDQALNRPREVYEDCRTMVSQVVREMNCNSESAIRLLSEGVGERAAMHPVNVTVMCLLLGKAMGMSAPEMEDLGVASFLHDIGKLNLPQRVRSFEDGFSIEEFRLYQDHVAQSLAIGQRMGLSAPVLTIIAQHHELMDGTGFPAKPPSQTLVAGSRILALVNRYDNLCNPQRLAAALTPHEALSLLFAQHKARFDTLTLTAFIRMMGVYPPGSVVQLIDGRYAIVVSVNSVRPLKPRLIVHEPSVPRHEALILDLETEPSIGIRRSLRPVALPADALEYLAPRQRISYYFGATDSDSNESD